MKKVLAGFLVLATLVFAAPPAVQAGPSDFFDSFQVVQTDTPGSPNYYMFVSPSGAFYIMRETTSSNVKTYAYYTYLLPAGDYATAWTGRAGLTYVAVEVAFKAVR